MEAFRLPDVLAAERADEDVGRLLEPADAVHVRVDVQRRVAHRLVEIPALAERPGDVEPHDQRVSGGRRVRRRLTADEAEGQQPGCEAFHRASPRATSPVTRAGKCVAAIKSSIDLNGSVKCGRPVKTTNRKLRPAATTCSTGSDTNTSRAMTAFSDFPAPAEHRLHPAAEQ